ncbi:unnamed protein product [Sphagnum jensenii]|uniref:RING-type E3 ubiquitin transferase n=1 Tax=Sphagnum jensenii TaxID=128206 RepID=A0ABP0WWG4_9BRYO
MATPASNSPQSQSPSFLGGDDSNSSNLGTPPSSTQMVNSKIMVVAVAVLFAVVVFIFCLHIYAKWFWHHQDAGALRLGRGSWRRGSSRRRSIDPLADDDQQQPHRPLFLLQSVGLEKSVVESLPTFVYKKEDFVAADGSSLPPPQQQQLECAVCLEEFKENETGRTLPKCGHSFHVECIDMWFHSHSSCPLCRTSAQPDGPAASPKKPSTALALTVAAHEGDGEETVTLNPSPSPSSAASTMDPSLAAATTTAAVGRNLQQQEAVDKPQIPPNVLFWGIGVGSTSLEQQEATSQHLRAVAAVAASGRSSSSARVRAPFQVAIDIPQASSTTAAFETTSSPFSTPKSPMGRFITFTRLLSRGKSIAAAAAAASPSSSSSSSSSSPPILHLPVDSEQAPAPLRTAAEP